ncbi:MAG: PHP domain-containing protein [bacterium]
MMIDAGRVDLHTHTLQSDGQHSPESLVTLAKSKKLVAIGITDHDEVGALDRARVKGEELDVAIIPGVELSTIHGGFDVHILGYFIDHHYPRLLSVLEYLRAERVARTHRILEKLEQLGMTLSFDAVLRQAGAGCLGRPHIAEAMVQAGFVRFYQEAFDIFLAEGRPAFEPKTKILPGEAVGIIHEAGGIASLAHPGQNLTLEVVLDVVKAGIEAIEIIHPKHTATQRRCFEKIASEFGLLRTGGSDFHGGRKGEEKFGQYTVSMEQVELLRKSAEKWH